MRQLLIKICGLTKPEDARVAVELGADFIGLIFVPETPRYIDERTAASIIEAVGKKAKTVGIFKNEKPAEINRKRAVLGLDLIQLHGQEPPDMVASLKNSVKALTAGTAEELNGMASDYASFADLLLFDRPKANPPELWLESVSSALAKQQFTKPFLLAGGINPENVAGVIQKLINNSSFAGIDIASGIESAPGIKDHTKMKALIQNARESAANAVAR